MDKVNIYKKFESERKKHVEAILVSKSKKKVVVAGPGTGKTFLFKKLLEGKKRSLTLTFINSLVEDLSLELYGLSEVKTLHSFARSIFSSSIKKSIEVFPKLSKVINTDAKILLGKQKDFDELFYNRMDDHPLVEFYKKRKDYYGYYGYTDIIFAAVKHFEKYRDKIPIFDQILVDEFQDFNMLEVSFIELLSEKSPILLVGDDDQALYDFKSASTRYIRERHSSKEPDYESFNLPYCARSTKVIVEAINDIINATKKAGFLNGRINKPYIYFASKSKDEESDIYPKIGYTQKFVSQMPWFIEQKISEMAEKVKGKFSVLIISPFKKQSHTIAEGLKTRGFKNIEYKTREDPEVSFLDGIKLLLEDKKNNLGWRIVSEILLSEEQFKSLLGNTGSSPEKNCQEFIDPECKGEVNKIIGVVKSVLNNKTPDINELDEILRVSKINPYELAKDLLKQEINITTQRIGNPAIRYIQTKATTIQSSKGLSGDLIFITHFDDRYFIKDKDNSNITDQEICNFLVSLSRAISKVYLISSTPNIPIFLNWISKDRLEFIDKKK